VAANPGEVLIARTGVHHGAEPGVGQVIDDGVVDDPAALVQHAAVERLAGRFELRHVVRQQPLQPRAHARATQVHHAHVRHVEHAGRAAHRVVLADLRAVLHRHVPAAEVHDARAQLLVQLEKRGLSSHRTSKRKRRQAQRLRDRRLPPFCPVT
jgi:hypothetical protein